MLSHFLGFLQTPFSTKAWSHCRCQSICKIYHVLCRGRSRGRKVLVAFNTKSSNKEEMLICPRRSNVLDVQMSSTFRRPRCSNVIDVQLLSTFKRYQRSTFLKFYTFSRSEVLNVLRYVLDVQTFSVLIHPRRPQCSCVHDVHNRPRRSSIVIIDVINKIRRRRRRRRRRRHHNHRWTVTNRVTLTIIFWQISSKRFSLLQNVLPSFSFYVLFFFYSQTETRKMMRWDADVAQWIRLHLPSCHHGFESQAPHLFF